ncbi:MAG: hypothetical protein MZV65_26325 [Chromatiales bacterium]|nr:hypothetical protein [Chromatiales bacterium]
MSNPVITAPSDDRLARVWPNDAAGFEHSPGEPVYLVIGSEAAGEDVARLLARFGLDEGTRAPAAHLEVQP